MPAQGVTVPVPTGGWNAFNSLDAMPPSDAVRLDNFFPETSYLRLRRGHTAFCSIGQSAPVQTLIEYTNGAASRLLAACAGSIFDVSSGTAASLAAGFGSDVWECVNFATPGGHFLVACNGVDAVQSFDGTTWGAATLTGVAPSTLSAVCSHAERLFFSQVGTLSVWYTAPGSFQGALTQFDVGSLCVRGGTIAAIGNWTRDDGFAGADELFVIVTTKGEVLVYQGVNPDDATNWSLVGRFLVGEPVAGQRSIMRTGPDMVLLCEDGFQPIATYLMLGETKAVATSISQKIGNATTAAVRAGKGLAGWQSLPYPQGTCIIVNVPVSAGQFQQFVVNSITGAWCRYLGMNAWCWSLFDARPYFGGDNGTVYAADVGQSDNGADIVGELITAYQYFGGRGKPKRFTMARPVLQVSGSLKYTLDVAIDYQPSPPLNVVSSNVPPAGLWGSGIWGTMGWGSSIPGEQQRRWTSVSGLGYAAALHLKVSTGTIQVNLNSIDLLFEVAGPGMFV